jgi:hypothetical protein
VGAVYFDIAIGIRLTNTPARLVAIGAQVALTTIEGHTFESVERYGVSGLKSPIFSRVGDVDLVAGTAVLAGWVWIPFFNHIWG